MLYLNMSSACEENRRRIIRLITISVFSCVTITLLGVAIFPIILLVSTTNVIAKQGDAGFKGWVIGVDVRVRLTGPN